MDHKNPIIDILRSWSILIVMLTHALVPFLGNPSISTLWNYLHFSVVAFVFCSGFGTIASFMRNTAKNGSAFQWILQRFFRLYIPFALYILVYWILTYLFPHVFRGQDFIPTPAFIMSSFSLTGGASMAWLPILFLELTILTPLYAVLLQNKKRLPIVFGGLLGISLLTVFFPLPASSSRITAWMFWGLIYLAGGASTMLLSDPVRMKKIMRIVAGTFILLHLVLFYYLRTSHLSTTLTSHKYPPDLFYFSYGIGINALILFFLTLFPTPLKIMSMVRFLARNSYSLLFIHWIALDGTIHMLSAYPLSIQISFSITISILILFIGNRLKLLLLQRCGK